MAQVHLRKYAALLTTAKAVTFSLFEVDGIDLRVDASFATGDVTISKDGGAEVNTTNLPVDEGKGYSLVLTLLELTASQVRISIVDQTGTKVWLDIELIVETYGNASAMHAFDLDTASVAQTADNDTKISLIPTTAMRGTDSAATSTKQDTMETTLNAIPTTAMRGTDGVDTATMRGTDGANTTTPLTAAGTRTALGLATPNMDVQFAASVTATGFNIGKTGYTLTQSFPANFASLVISATGDANSDINKINGVVISGDGSINPFDV